MAFLRLPMMFIKYIFLELQEYHFLIPDFHLELMWVVQHKRQVIIIMEHIMAQQAL
jgi:hypothetical protein